MLFQLLIDGYDQELWYMLEGAALVSGDQSKFYSNRTSTKMVKLLNLNLDQWIEGILTSPTEGCERQRITIQRFLNNKFVRKNLNKSSIKKYRKIISDIEKYKKQDERFEKGLLKLPKIPQDLLIKSQQIHKLAYEKYGFDIHEEELNFLGGRRLSHVVEKPVVNKIRTVENLFEQECKLPHEAFVFRGLVVHNIKNINSNPRTITFVTPNLEKAKDYMEGFRKTIPILMIIRLPKGTPIISTNLKDALVLPYRGRFKQYGQPYYFHKACQDGKVKEIPFGGAAIYYDYIPHSRFKFDWFKKILSIK